MQFNSVEIARLRRISEATRFWKNLENLATLQRLEFLLKFTAKTAKNSVLCFHASWKGSKEAHHLPTLSSFQESFLSIFCFETRINSSQRSPAVSRLCFGIKAARNWVLISSWRSECFEKLGQEIWIHPQLASRTLSHCVLNLLFLVCFLEASVQKCRLFWALLWLNFFTVSLSKFTFRIPQNKKRISGHSETPKKKHLKNRYQKLFAKFKFSIFLWLMKKNWKIFEWLIRNKKQIGWLEASGMSRKMFKLLEGSWIFCWLFYISLGQSVNY
jgi:hypothetical protein